MNTTPGLLCRNFNDSTRAILFRRVCDRETRVSREIIAKEVRAEISRLEQVLVLLGEAGHGHVKPAGWVSSGAVTDRKPRRKMSAAGRKKIAAAQRARWAKIRAAKK